MNTKIKTALAIILLFAVSCKKESNTIQTSEVDYVGSTSDRTDITEKYTSVKIGTQKWMTKNLDVTHYRNGDKIPQVKDPTKWSALTTGAWCWYNNDSATGAVYGRLYNWYAVNDPRGLAPTGWHVPSDTEWNTLKTYLGNNAGGKLKDTGTIEAGTGLWYAPNTGATNETGFTGLPGGYRYPNGTFYRTGGNGSWWSSTQYGTGGAWVRSLHYDSGNINGHGNNDQDGLSVRCLKD